MLSIFSVKEFEEIIKPFLKSSVSKDSTETSDYTSESELLALKDKTNRHLRTKELLLKHSQDASLIIL